MGFPKNFPKVWICTWIFFEKFQEIFLNIFFFLHFFCIFGDFFFWGGGVFSFGFFCCYTRVVCLLRSRKRTVLLSIIIKKNCVAKELSIFSTAQLLL